jgi:hypothetical protein
MPLYAWKSFIEGNTIQGFGVCLADSKQEAIGIVMQIFKEELEAVKRAERQLEWSRINLYSRFSPATRPTSIIDKRFEEYAKLEQNILQILNTEESTVIDV